MNTETSEQCEKRKTLEELFENYSGEYIAEETDRGDDVGKEKWYEMNIT
ncbi:MAG: hypothetical protein J5997_11510 [Oscillospiraceae bacterium]|nr:hypothetical protein [Oscillospiraceae bacterium]